MDITIQATYRSIAGTGFVGLLICVAASAAAADRSSDSIQQRYQRERADCLAGRSPQPQAVCLQEAGAARVEARRHSLSSPVADFTRNQQQRCEPLPPSDRQACIARMSGQGKTRGSVAEGGIYRELTTRTTGAPVVVVEPASAPAARAPR